MAARRTEGTERRSSFTFDLGRSTLGIARAVANVALSRELNGHKEFPPRLTSRGFAAEIDVRSDMGPDIDRSNYEGLIAQKLALYAQDGFFNIHPNPGFVDPADVVLYEISPVGARAVAEFVEAERRSLSALASNAASVVD